MDRPPMEPEETNTSVPSTRNFIGENDNDDSEEANQLVVDDDQQEEEEEVGVGVQGEEPAEEDDEEEDQVVDNNTGAGGSLDDATNAEDAQLEQQQQQLELLEIRRQKERQEVEMLYQNDLVAYELARRLRLMDLLLEAQSVNSMACPLFYSVLDARANNLARTALQYLHQRHPRLPSTISSYILKFLCFPDLVTEQLPERPALQAEPIMTIGNSSSDTQQQTNIPPDASVVVAKEEENSRKRQRSLSQSFTETEEVERSSASDAIGASKERLSLQLRPSQGTSKEAEKSRMSVSSQFESGIDKKATPRFFVRLPTERGRDSGMLGRQGVSVNQRISHLPDVVIPATTTRLFVRMVASTVMDEEQMNTYFGRYGQVSCERLTVKQLRIGPRGNLIDDDNEDDDEEDSDEYDDEDSDESSDDSGSASDSSRGREERSSNRRGASTQHGGQRMKRSRKKWGTGAAAGLTSAAARAAKSQRGHILVQDFYITVDTPANALMAVLRAYFDRLVFVALSDPRYNCYTEADILPTTNNPLVHLQRIIVSASNAAFPGSGSGSGAAGGAAGGAKGDGSAGSGELGALGKQGNRGAMMTDKERAAMEELSFVPDVVVDGFPFWMSSPALRNIFSQYGRVESVRMSIDDRSGAFTGAVLVRMSTAREALEVSERMNGYTTESGSVLVSGVLTPTLDIVTLRDGSLLREAEPLPEGFVVDINTRLWL